MRVGSLCSGYDGLFLGVQAVLPDAELAWVSDVEPGPCAVLAHHYPSVPNLGDLTRTEWGGVPEVHMLIAGYPCQPFSSAGRRLGEDDERHLWPHVADAIRTLRPGVVVLENVAGHLSLGGLAVIGDLAAFGYDARWTVVRASDVGACHRRARWFCVATHTASIQSDERPTRRNGETRGEPWLSQTARGSHRATADTDRGGCCSKRHGHRCDVDGCRSSGTNWGQYEPAIRRHEHALGRCAPPPTDANRALNPVFVEWMQMLPEGWVTDVPDPVLSLQESLFGETPMLRRTRLLRMLGNGVVPPQAAYAMHILGLRAAQ